jgi:hypothetical protein
MSLTCRRTRGEDATAVASPGLSTTYFGHTLLSVFCEFVQPLKKSFSAFVFRRIHTERKEQTIICNGRFVWQLSLVKNYCKKTGQNHVII